MPVFPSSEEIAAWNALSRDEQLENMKLDLQEAIDSGEAQYSMEQTVERAKARIAEHRSTQ